MKLYSEKQVDISAGLGGPIPPGLLIYRNYATLGRTRESYIALAVTLIFTIVFFYGIMQLPQTLVDRIPNIAFNALYAVLVFIFYRLYLAKDIQAAMDGGATKASNWSVAGLTLGGMLLNVAIIYVMAMYQPFYEGQLLTARGNQLYYDAESVKDIDAKLLAEEFEVIDFFGPDYGNIAKLEKTDSGYSITMVVDEQIWSNEELMKTLTGFKWIMEDKWSTPTALRLESVSLSGTSRYKDL